MNAETFWSNIGVYNEVTLPFQAFLIITAVILTYFTFAKPSAKTDIWMKVFLAFAFAWNGVVFFLIFVRNPISTYFGAPLFIILAILFVIDIFSKRTEFRLPDVKWRKALTLLWISLVVLYPVFGLPLGHAYPGILTPVMPCPITVFAITMIAAAIPKADKKVYILLLPWALAGLPKCLGALNCFEDCILFASGVYGLVLLIKNWKSM